MKYITNLFILFVFLNTNCQVDHHKESNKKLVRHFPKVFDTIGISKFIYSKDEAPTWLTTSNYKMYFIGKIMDTIFLNPYLNFGPFAVPEGVNHEIKEEIKPNNRLKSYFLEWPKRKKYKFWYDINVKILVDTNNSISNSYPTLLENFDKDTIIIGYGQQIPIVMEAKDSSGNWKPIQERFIYGCGVGVGSIILPPNECLLTLAPIYNGNFRTAIRLTLGKSHSNTFYGKIFYRQFQSMFDKRGNYKEEYKLEMENEATNR